MSSSAGWADAARWVDEAILGSVVPPPNLSPSEWSERYGKVPGVGSSEPGDFRLSRTPHIREILDRFGPDDPCERVVCEFGAQLQKTTVILMVTGYYMHWRPAAQLTYFPNVKPKLENFVRQRLDPMLSDIPELASLVAGKARGNRKASDTITLKEFPGGIWTGNGASTANAFRASSAGIILMDEFDDYDDDIEGEGAPDRLAWSRAASFRGRRKLGLFSTPTIAELSKIDNRYQETDQRHYYVPCPECGHMQQLYWRDPDTKEYRVVWEPGKAREARYRCRACDALWENWQKVRILEAGEWRADRADLSAWDGRSHGYQMSSLYANHGLGWSWGEIAEFWEAIHAGGKVDIAQLKWFVNTVLGETWEDHGMHKIEPDAIEARSEATRSTKHGVFDPMPEWVQAVFVGVDTHDSSHPYQVWGVGPGYESCSVEYGEVLGDPAMPATKRALDELLRRTFKTADGRELPIAAAAIDMGGHRADDVYRFCRERKARNIIAIKGAKDISAPIWDRRPRTKTSGQSTAYMIGVNAAKDLIFAWLRVEERGPGFIHFPFGRDRSYFHGLVASERKLPRLENGRRVWRWVEREGVPNEPLDTLVYAVAALRFWEFKGNSIKGATGAIVNTSAPARPLGGSETSPQSVPERASTLRPPARTNRPPNWAQNKLARFRGGRLG